MLIQSYNTSIASSALEISLCTNKFCLLFSSSWSQMLPFVINVDSLMRGGVCRKLHGGRSQLLFALQQSSIDSQIFVENLDFCLPLLHSRPPLGVSPSEYCHNIWYKKKLEWCGYPTVKKNRRYVYSFTNEHDRRTDKQIHTVWRHRPRLHSFARHKWVGIIFYYLLLL